MAVTACPDCGHRIALKGRAELGRRLTCLHCGAELKVTGTEPLKVARAFSQ
ncbi:MAG: lysine biosynthesis protein LysW [Anaerolineae bacterium]|nr:lysine biosynthesis protein LysW [Anaerolineae bacterium]